MSLNLYNLPLASVPHPPTMAGVCTGHYSFFLVGYISCFWAWIVLVCLFYKCLGHGVKLKWMQNYSHVTSWLFTNRTAGGDSVKKRSDIKIKTSVPASNVSYWSQYCLLLLKHPALCFKYRLINRVIIAYLILFQPRIYGKIQTEHCLYKEP